MKPKYVVEISYQPHINRDRILWSWVAWFFRAKHELLDLPHPENTYYPESKTVESELYYASREEAEKDARVIVGKYLEATSQNKMSQYEVQL